MWDTVHDDEVGRFHNEYGERFIVFSDQTFASDETDWKRVSIDPGHEIDEETFLFSVAESDTVGSILLTAGILDAVLIPIFDTGDEKQHVVTRVDG